MIEWLRWIVILGLIVGAYVEGKRQGAQDQVVEHQAQAIKQRDGVIEDLNAQVEAKDGNVEKAQADMVKVQDDLAAIRRASSSVGTQLRSALDASQMGTCLLDPPVRGMRADSAKATDAAVGAANRARDPG